MRTTLEHDDWLWIQAHKAASQVYANNKVATTGDVLKAAIHIYNSAPSQELQRKDERAKKALRRKDEEEMRRAAAWSPMKPPQQSTQENSEISPEIRGK